MPSFGDPASKLEAETPADLEAWPRRIAAVTTESLAAAAATVLDRRRAVTGRLLSAAA